MATFHARSDSFPSNSHPVMAEIRQALSCNKFGTWVNEILEGSLRLVDLCGFSREIICSTKESVQDLESSIRRNRGETATANDIKSYLTSRKNINKVVNKYIKNLKSFNQNPATLLEEDNALKIIVIVLKEMEAISFSVLKSVLLLLSGANERSKQRNWPFPSKFTQKTNHAYSKTNEESGSEDLFNLHVCGRQANEMNGQFSCSEHHEEVEGNRYDHP